MQDQQIGRISNFIWSVADDVLRDLYMCGKYRDVILPMTVLRRLDAVLEPTKETVLNQKKALVAAGITAQEGPLRQAAGQDFYNASQFTPRGMLDASSKQQLTANFELNVLHVFGGRSEPSDCASIEAEAIWAL